MNDQHRRSNITNRLMGSYQAQVVDVEHPDGLYLASVRLLGLWDNIPDPDLPWAEFLLPLGAKPSSGHAVPVEAEDYVWVDFPRNGDTRFPRITGSLYHAPNYQSNLPDEVNGNAYQPLRAKDEPEPAIYTRKDDIYDRFGFRELRTHDGGYSITHKSSGSAIEFTPKGEIVIHSERNLFESTTQNKLSQIDSGLTIKVGNNCRVEAGGEVYIQSQGDATVDAASVNLKSKGDVSVEAGGLFLVTATAANFQLG